MSSTTRDGLDENICIELDVIAEDYELNLKTQRASQKFKELIRKLNNY